MTPTSHTRGNHAERPRRAGLGVRRWPDHPIPDVDADDEDDAAPVAIERPCCIGCCTDANLTATFHVEQRRPERG